MQVYQTHENNCKEKAEVFKLSCLGSNFSVLAVSFQACSLCWREHVLNTCAGSGLGNWQLWVLQNMLAFPSSSAGRDYISQWYQAERDPENKEIGTSG